MGSQDGPRPVEQAVLAGLTGGTRDEMATWNWPPDTPRMSPIKIGKQFIKDLEEYDLADRIGKLKRPLLVFHSPVDTIVGIDNAERIFKAAKHPKSFVSLGKADHLVSKPEDAQFLGHVLSAWAGYYVVPPAM